MAENKEFGVWSLEFGVWSLELFPGPAGHPGLWITCG